MKKIEIDIEDAIRDMGLSNRWDLLQLLWDDLERNGCNEAWQHFFDENGIAKRNAGK